MADPVTISPEPPVNKGLDYAFLKEEGTRLCQQLSGNIWTDYNESDPGVTTLEQLCYALTELSYRSQFPLEDLLIDHRAGRIRTRRQALFIPRRILPCSPVTENDYRKLIVDRVAGVENVWLTRHSSRVPERSVNGLYDIWVYAPALGPPICELAAVERLLGRVRRLYCRNRGLCEDIHRVYILNPVRTVVEAIVTVDNTRTVDAILAAILFNVGSFMAPELRREPLKTLVDRGDSPDEIFNGPLLRDGFIADAQLQPKASEIAVQELVKTIARSPGVLGVRNVRVRVDGRARAFEGNQSIPVEMKDILALETDPGPGGSFTIKLFKNGVECSPNAVRVRTEMERLWSEYRRTYRLLPQYREFFSVPRGRYRNVEQYYSVQNQYPNVYGISADGLPEDATRPRRGQAKQLKGYLMVFDQLMADFFAQLARVGDLYSIDPALANTYFYQYLYDSVPDVEPLLDDDYDEGLPAIVKAEDPFNARRNRFLDLLLALYAERIDASSLAGTSCDAGQAAGEGADLIAAKLALLRRLVASTHDRGRGFDYLSAPSPRNIAGMEIKSRIQLGISDPRQRRLSDLLQQHGFEIAESEEAASIGPPAIGCAEQVEEEFSPVSARTEGDADYNRRSSEAWLRGHRISEGFMRAASDPRNFRTGRLPGDSALSLVCKSRGETDWRMVGKFEDQDAAEAAAHIIAEIAGLFLLSCRQLYIVEHNLLRFGRSGEREAGEPVHEEPGRPGSRRFVYSFTITVVASTTLAAEIGDEYKRIVKEIIRQNAPSHIVAAFCFLKPDLMRTFEILCLAWHEALRGADMKRIVRTSADLRRFLQAACRTRPV